MCVQHCRQEIGGGVIIVVVESTNIALAGDVVF
jgi:hypothetical protein